MTPARAVTQAGDPDIVRQALIDSLVKLLPQHQWKQPGDVRRLPRQHPDHGAVRAGARRAEAKRRRLHPRHHAVAVVHGAVRQFRRSRSPRAAARRRRDSLRSAKRDIMAKKLDQPKPRCRLLARRRRAHCARATCSWSRRGLHSGRRRSDRRRGLGGRIGDHRRIGAGHPRIRRRLLLGHRRHARAVRLAGRARHGQSRRSLPRPHDRDGRERAPAEDAERNRADASCW